MKEQASVLSIRRQPGGYTLEFERGDEPLRNQPTKQALPIAVERDVMVTIGQLLEKGVLFANGGEKGGHDEAQLRFKAGGGGLFEALFSKRDLDATELRRAVWVPERPLLLVTDEPNLLWELLNDGAEDGFLALKFEVGRQLFARRVPSVAVPKRHSWRCLLIADPNEDEPAWALPETAAEARKLRQSLEARGVNCDDYLQGREATHQAVTEKLLLHEYDIIHYAGHVVRQVVDNHSQYALRLNGGKLLFASSLQKHVKGNPIVFLNACFTAQATELATAVDRVQSLTNAFLEGGAQVVVGSLFSVPDEGGRVFAETFYRQVLDGATLGRAMRMARNEVYGKPEYGAAWACFVMYGDPCLRLEISVDELELMLKAVGLQRRDFDPTGIEILEKAMSYGGRARFVATPHVFAALVAMTSTGVHDWLERNNVLAETLHRNFQKLFDELSRAVEERQPGDASHPQTPVGLSENARAILDRARSLTGKGLISSEVLVKAFAQTAGGRTGEILRTLGVDVHELDPDWRHNGSRVDRRGPTSATAADEVRGGGLTPRNCTKDVWDTVVTAAAHAAHRGLEGIDSTSLFAAMMQRRDGPLARAFDRLARATGRRYALDQGLIFEALGSRLILQDGRIDRDCFDRTGRFVIDEMIDLAQRRHHRVLSRRHLLFGLLSEPDGAMARKLREHGGDAEVLAGLLATAMTSGDPAPAAHVELSSGLLRLLCAADALTLSTSRTSITSADLLEAFIRDGGGEAGEFLLRNGVNWKPK
jgi:hypothetical protein